MRSEEIIDWVVGPDVLDVGCTGHETPDPANPQWVHGQLRNRFPEVWGLDNESSNVESLRAMGYQNIIEGDAQSFELGKTFDTVVAGEIIEHLENPGAFLACAYNHLKDGGRLVLTTPYPFGLAQVLYALLKFPKTVSNPQHTCWFCPATLRAVAERIGFRVGHWHLLLDTIPSDSKKYNSLLKILWLVRPLLPQRLTATTMFFVLEKGAKGD